MFVVLQHFDLAGGQVQSFPIVFSTCCQRLVQNAQSCIASPYNGSRFLPDKIAQAHGRCTALQRQSEYAHNAPFELKDLKVSSKVWRARTFICFIFFLRTAIGWPICLCISCSSFLLSSFTSLALLCLLLAIPSIFSRFSAVLLCKDLSLWPAINE